MIALSRFSSCLALSVFPMLVATGCSADHAEEDTAADATESDLSAFSNTVIALRKDTRTCAAPACGGYFVRDVNRTASETYVSRLEFTEAANAFAEHVESAPDGEVLVRGRLSALDLSSMTRRLIVSEAWRGLPGVTFDDGAVFYRVSQVGFTHAAVRLNVGTSRRITEVVSDLAARPELDAAWLLRQPYDGDAIVAGSVVLARAWIPVLGAEQIFLKLGAESSCAAPSASSCAAGKKRAFTRDLDRCLAPAACVAPAPAAECGPAPSACPAGFTATTWLETSGCKRRVCEPSFLD